MKLEEVKDVNVKFPEEYFSKELAGKDATFKVTLHEIKMKELPKVDDEFAKDVSEFDTLNDLKADLKAKKEKQNEENSKAELEEKAIRAVAEVSEVEIPNGMVEVELENMAQDMDRRLSYQGFSLEQYLKMLGKTMADFKNENEAAAKESIKLRLVLEAVCKDAKVEAPEKEVNEKIADLAKAYGRKEEELKQNEEFVKNIEESVKSEKAIALIIENAKVKTVEPKAAEEKKTAKKATKTEETKTTKKSSKKSE